MCCLQAASSVVAQDAASGPKSTDPAVRRVFVPIEELDVVLNRDKKGVLLPREEFMKLYKKARRRAEATARQPQGIVLSNAEYQLRLSGAQLLISARIEFTQFTDRWQTLALPFRGMTVEKATLNDRPARLGRLARFEKQGGSLYFLHHQAGPATLLLELSSPLASLGSDRVAAFGLIPSPAATLKATLPAGKHLMVDGLLLQRPSAIDRQAAYSVAVGGKTDVRLRITDRRTQHTTDVLVFAITGFGVHVTPGEVTWQAATTLQVYGRPFDRLVFSVPNTLEIVDVESTGLESWELADDTDDATRTSITLSYRQPFDGLRTIALRGVLTTQAGRPWTVPNLKFSGGTSHVGRMTVTHPSGVRLRLEKSTGLRRVTVDERSSKRGGSKNRIGGAVSKLAFNVWREDFMLGFVTQTKQREVFADNLTVLNLTSKGLEVNTIATLQSLYAPLFEVDVTLPAEWAVTAVGANCRPVEWRVLKQQADGHRVRIPLNPPLWPGRQTQLHLSARRDLEKWPLEDDKAEFALPEVRLMQASVIDGSYVIQADEDFEVVPLEISGLDPAHLKVPGERFGYRYQDTRFSGRIRVQRKPPRISARTLAFTRLDRQALRSHLEVMLEVAGGGIRSLEIALPESVGEELRFLDRGARIVDTLRRVSESVRL